MSERLADLAETLRCDAAKYRKLQLFDIAQECDAHAQMVKAALAELRDQIKDLPILEGPGPLVKWVPLSRVLELLQPTKEKTR